MITKCFFEKPNLRPDFNEIKTLLETAYDVLNSSNESLDGSCSIKPKINEAKDNTMKNRYNSVLKGNSNSACNGPLTKLDHSNKKEESNSSQYTELNVSNTNEKKSSTIQDFGIQYSSINHSTSSTSKKEFKTNINKSLVKCVNYRHSMNSIATQKQLQNISSITEQRYFHTLPKKCQI